MKLLPFSLLILMISCLSSNKDHEKADQDYVLIEFASKLEEDYHRIESIPYEPEFHHHNNAPEDIPQQDILEHE